MHHRHTDQNEIRRSRGFSQEDVEMNDVDQLKKEISFKQHARAPYCRWNGDVHGNGCQRRCRREIICAFLFGCFLSYIGIKYNATSIPKELPEEPVKVRLNIVPQNPLESEYLNLFFPELAEIQQQGTKGPPISKVVPPWNLAHCNTIKNSQVTALILAQNVQNIKELASQIESIFTTEDTVEELIVAVCRNSWQTQDAPKVTIYSVLQAIASEYTDRVKVDIIPECTENRLYWPINLLDSIDSEYIWILEQGFLPKARHLPQLQKYFNQENSANGSPMIGFTGFSIDPTSGKKNAKEASASPISVDTLSGMALADACLVKFVAPVTKLPPEVVQNDPFLTFAFRGLGRARPLVVPWPNGEIQRSTTDDGYDEKRTEHHVNIQLDLNAVPFLLCVRPKDTSLLKLLYMRLLKNPAYTPIIAAIQDEDDSLVSSAQPLELCAGVGLNSLYQALNCIAFRTEKLFEDYMRFIEVHPPVATLWVEREDQAGALLKLGSKELGLAWIAVPPQDASHLKFLSTLPPQAIASWNTPHFTISIITTNRCWSLKRLMKSAKAVHYLGDEVPITFHLDNFADNSTLQYIQQLDWPHGGKHIRFRVVKGGLIAAVSESYYPSDVHHYGILLEDDVEVSPFYFVWVKYAVLMYQYGKPEDFMSSMFGISLYAPRKVEVPNDRYAYDSVQLYAFRTGKQYMPYLYQIPCSWGAVYFPELWIEFRQYMKERMDIQQMISGSRTNGWTASWKKYFIEMSFERHYFMLYPNFHNQTAFSTNHLEKGEHIVNTTYDPEHRPKDYTIPLMNVDFILEELPGHQLPPLKHLPRADIFHQPTT